MTSTIHPEGLKPCPFCGHGAPNPSDEGFMYCDGCESSVPEKWWNRRALAPVPPLLEVVDLDWMRGDFKDLNELHPFGDPARDALIRIFLWCKQAQDRLSTLPSVPPPPQGAPARDLVEAAKKAVEEWNAWIMLSDHHKTHPSRGWHEAMIDLEKIVRALPAVATAADVRPVKLRARRRAVGAGPASNNPYSVEVETQTGDVWEPLPGTLIKDWADEIVHRINHPIFQAPTPPNDKRGLIQE